jgi:hypothetical protein
LSTQVPITPTDALLRLADRAALRVLSEQDRDPYSPTRGCFDRRFWAWKLVDFPEATFQRHVYPLAVLYGDRRSQLYQREEVRMAIADGLRFAFQIQHRNGSFDQAFPYEQSWGATAFLLHPLLASMELVASLDIDTDVARKRLSAAAGFLKREGERHGLITNHLAGGALSLQIAGMRLNDRESRDRAETMVAEIVASQSPEGWFPEYGGADPGYQTLCLYYLAEVAQLAPTPALEASLDRALEFLQWFVHPDGTFGGSYGSRRTRIAYLGGFARLAGRSPLAAAMLQTLSNAVIHGAAISIDTVDSGNLAPLFTNLVSAIDQSQPAAGDVTLPAFQPLATRDFTAAGLHVRSTQKYFAIVGVSNGATLTVFDRDARTLIHDDGGYVGELSDGARITSQVSQQRHADVASGEIATTVTFHHMPKPVPTPALFLILRVLNLTLMRSIAIGNMIKRLLVKRLMTGQSETSLRVRRRIVFGDRIEIEDHFENPAGLALRWLRGGVAFNSIHMASAGYFEPASLRGGGGRAIDVDVETLRRDKALVVTAALL